MSLKQANRSACVSRSERRDQMVDRCPNCGQTLRPGARFCTSCGFRLPEQAPPEQPPAVGRSPFETTSTVAPWWQSTPRSEAPAETPSA
ncbi:MAG: hypothetical protein C4345_02000, partial [Chloroflexota bacterium]